MDRHSNKPKTPRSVENRTGRWSWALSSRLITGTLVCLTSIVLIRTQVQWSRSEPGDDWFQEIVSDNSGWQLQVQAANHGEQIANDSAEPGLWGTVLRPTEDVVGDILNAQQKVIDESAPRHARLIREESEFAPVPSSGSIQMDGRDGASGRNGAESRIPTVVR